MSTHVSAELLSAYLDRQLAGPEARQLEEHLDRCERCHVRLEGLRKVVTHLQTLDPLTPPSGLQAAVARRIQLSDRQPNLLDRFEQGISIFDRQSPILAMFAVIIALAMFIYLFSYALHQDQSGSIEVIFQDPPGAAAAEDQAIGSRLTAGGRQLVWSVGGLWVEEGADVDAVARTLAVDSDEGRDFLAAHPELADLAALDRSVVIRLGGEIVRLD